MKRTLHSVMKKIIASVFALVLVITGVCLIQTEGSKVFAATTATPQATVKNMIAAGEAPSAEDGKIFAGWYSDANYGSVIKSANAVPAAGAYAKFVDSDVLGVKLQSQEIDGLTNLRIVTSVDSLNYTNVGFEIAVGTKTFSYDTDKVLNEIEASAESGVTYEYTPNVVDEDSKYFMTLTITGIPSTDLNEAFYIRPYWTTYDGTKVYGISRYVSVNDGNSTTVANLPIQLSEGTTLTANNTVSVTMTHYNLDGSTSQTTAQATVKKVEDNGYAHLNIAVDDKTALNSATVVSLSTGEKAVYRNLDSSYTTNQKKADISWFKAYEAMGESEKYVIATSADLYGFQQLSASSDFASQNISLCADVTVNPDTWDAKADAVTTPEFSWTPIGKSGLNSSGKVFAGVFDGKGHEISGLYFSTTAEGLGMFGQIAGATIQNVKVKNSYFCASGSGWNNLGSIVGSGYGTISNAYSDASVISNGQYCGGIAGVASGGTLNISGCWFAGSMQANGTGQARSGGILGAVLSSGVGKISGCLNSGAVSANTDIANANAMLGGLLGYMEGEATIASSLGAGMVTTNADNIYAGAIIGYRNGKTLTISSDAPVYGVSESYTYNGSGHLGGFYYNSTNAWPNAQVVTKANATGIISSMNLNLDFYDVDDNKSGVWVAVDGSNPIPKVFADEAQNALTDSSIDWYADGTYLIENLADFRGFAELVKFYNFDGKTVKLNADITLNKKGNATDWETTAPKETWSPIGFTEESATTQKYQKFSGTFDGQGHTLSGFYVKNNTYQTGLFGYVYYATIKDLKLTNSYIESSVSSGHQYANTGSIAACGYVKMSDVYSDAVIVSNGNYVGGLFGRPYHNIASTFTNCWFDGTLKLKGETGIKGGGIVGAVEGAPCELTNCLSSGSLSSEKSTNKAYLGGLIGYYSKAVTLRNCLSTADISTNAVDIYSGSVIGQNGGGSLTYTNVYAMFESCVINGLSNIGQIPVASTTVLNRSALTGVISMVNTKLDFYDANGNTTGVWVAVNNGTPVLKKFAGEVEQVDTTKYSVDWYSADATEYTLYDIADMRGFKELAKINNFSGKTVKLGADITVNAGTAANWGVTPPAEEWEPIGRSGINSGYAKFAGTFDGQGHTISGIYMKTDKSGIGLFGTTDNCTIKNFKLTNSYFECTSYDSFSEAKIGSVLGEGSGTLDSIYSDAIVVSAGQFSGGLMGKSETTGAVANKITNCWFDGELTLQGTQGVIAGGILGGIYAGGYTIEHCLNSGIIVNKTETTANLRTGGLMGWARTGTITLNDCLNVGSVTFTGKSSDATTGSIFGWDCSTTHTYTNVYTTYESSSSAGATSSTVTMVHVGDVKGDEAKINMSALDYANYWESAYNSTPILQSFGANAAIDAIAGTTAIADSRGDGNYMVTVTRDTSETTYSSYVSSLTNNGYTLHVDNSAATELANYVKTATYTKDGMAMTVTHMTKTGTTYLTACKDLPLSKHLKYDSSYLTGNVSGKKTTLTNLAMYTDVGTSMVIQLKNGHFIVIDGGVQATKDCDYLLQYLKKLSSTPIIDAWIFSHFHNDHAGIMRNFVWEAASVDGIYVEGIYYNEPNKEVFEMESGSNSPAVMKRFTELASQMFTTTDGGHPETYRLQTGQRYYFNDITMDVVFAQDQLPKENYYGLDGANFNDSSTWVTFTIEGSKVMNTADADRGSMDWVIENYAGGYLHNLTMVTAPHHSWNPYQAFVDAISVKSVIINAGVWGSVIDFGHGDKYQPNDNLKAKSEEWLSWRDTGGIVYSFPSGGYTKGNYTTLRKNAMP